MTRMNRLADSQSPYLLQHADNPVDWRPWSDDAFAEARRREVPVLLSVGYAACHWCHVMAHESFEDEATADYVNEHFVAVKVDREERPDVDAVYMEAVQAATGQGGWPMTVFLTPTAEPFYFGTYFPPEPRHRMPSFRQVLEGVATAWAERRDEVAEVAGRIVRDLAGRGIRYEQPQPPGPEDQAGALLELTREFDAARGGFGDTPKFPPSMALEFLLRHHARTGSDGALEMVRATCDAMARGGIYDQLAGGFARYSVDGGWVVPHFEKMLYDNALLCRVYAHAWRTTGAEQDRRIALETADFMVRELGTSEGGFASALDADSEEAVGRDAGGGDADGRAADGEGGREADGREAGGEGGRETDGEGGQEADSRAADSRDADSRAADSRAAAGGGGGRHREGAYYVWTPRQLAEVLGETDAAWAAGYFGVTEEGTFEEGASVLQLSGGEPDDADRAASVRQRLLAARERRPRPERDDKIVAAWNGLAIAALAETGAYFDRPDLIEAAADAARLLTEVHLTDGRLVRTSRDGTAGTGAGVLEDYADVAEGFLALYSVTGRAGWLEQAGALLDTVLDRFTADDGTLYDTADDAETLIRRPQDPTDTAAPSGWTAAAQALLTYAAYTGSARHREAAERALGIVRALATRAPRFISWGLAAAEAALDGPREVAVVGPADDPATAALHRTALLATAPGAAVALGEPGSDAALRVPLLRDRPTQDGHPTAYVCRDFTCDAPTGDPETLERSLENQR